MKEIKDKSYRIMTVPFLIFFHRKTLYFEVIFFKLYNYSSKDKNGQNLNYFMRYSIKL